MRLWMLGCCLIVTVGLITPVTVLADSVTFEAGDATHSATAVFTMVGSNLQITLTNTDTHVASLPNQFLEGLLFNYQPPTLFTPISAVLGAGSTILNYQNNVVAYRNPLGQGGNVGGETIYQQIIPPYHSNDEGVATAQLTLGSINDFTGPANFNGDNLYGLTGGVWGPDYSIVGTGGTTALFPVISNSVVFTLAANDLSLDGVRQVTFKYGNFAGGYEYVDAIPEPLTMLGVVASAGCVAGYLRRKRQLA